MSYSANFIDAANVPLPELKEKEVKRYRDSGLQVSKYRLDYTNFSLLHNPFRKFPYFTAANINGKQFKELRRADLFTGTGDKWSKDKRIPENEQWGYELYDADKSDFDRGHLTKREDVQWGRSKHEAKGAAESTFYYTNSVPQVDRLNRGIWRKIEDYILHQEVVSNDLKINLFTGPFLLDNDPNFVTRVNNEVVQLPCLFWKVIYYVKDGELHRTAFLTSQRKQLKKKKIIKTQRAALIGTRGGADGGELFMDFKDAKTYQVEVKFIEELGNVTFQSAKESFSDDRPKELILEGADVRSGEFTNLSDAKINLVL